VIGKEILWFHAVIWPALLMALGLPLPQCVYAHSFWIREGRKMSKTLGNFIDLPTIEAYCAAYSRDAYRWYMLTQGPLGATDADFAHGKFIEVYNADLANGIGNAASRVSNMIAKYFDGKQPTSGATTHAGRNWPALALAAMDEAQGMMGGLDVASALRAGLGLSNKVDAYIHETEPFKLAKDPAKMAEVGTILANSAEALRIAAVLLAPAMPEKMGDLLGRLGQQAPDEKGRFARPLKDLCAWGGLKPGTAIVKGDALFPRADPEAPAPVAAEAEVRA
jgi:methionyl-tRNA synthetase